MLEHTPHHHITRKLKRTLFLTIGGGIVLAALLTAGILIITSVINKDMERNQQTAQTDVKQALALQGDFTLPTNTSNVPAELDPSTLVDVVAKNQPAVVRILSIYCANLTLSHSDQTEILKDTCAAGVGRGSIVSSDGYIATNGHVAIVTPKQSLLAWLNDDTHIDQYVAFLLAAGLVSESDGALLTAGTARSSELLQSTVSQLPADLLKATAATTLYAVQLGNDPVRMVRDGERLSVDFSDTIVSATLIDQDYNPEASDAALTTGQFTTSDVALLKAEGSFPYVRLGSINTVEPGDRLTAIGFPAFIDNSVNTDQWQTIPSITQGEVKDISLDATVNGRKIISTSVQIAQGNSGGPSFNDDGEQIGINTYSDLQCEDLKCFGDGLVRDIADLKALIDRNHITLKTGGINDDWYEGLDAYQSANYATALTAFQKVQNEYPANYLVAPLARHAREQLGTNTDTSSAFQARTVVVIVLVIVAGIALVIIFTVSFLVVYFTRKHRRMAARS